MRIRESSLRSLCEKEHPELWRRYLQDGSTPTMEDILAAEDADDSPLEQLLAEPEADPWDELVPLEEAADEDDTVELEEREPRIRRPRDRPRRGGLVARPRKD